MRKLLLILFFLFIAGTFGWLYHTFFISRKEASPTISATPFEGPKNPTVNNPRVDFGGTNIGDSIYFSWSPADHVHKYVRFRAYSIDGPWEEEGHIPGSLTNGVDITPEAREKTLCYRLEARDAKGVITRKYEPICIPKYEE